MKIIYRSLIILFSVVSCQTIEKTTAEKSVEVESLSHKNDGIITKKYALVNLVVDSKNKQDVVSFKYSESTIDKFFVKLVNNHIQDYIKLDSNEFSLFIEDFNISISDSLNMKKYFTIKILHDLFTSKESNNYSRGKILNIPYMWHWVNPNPRYEIYYANDSTLLKDKKAPESFHKYNSYADIDRTPYKYLSDFFSEKPKYYSELGGSFYTFGWCSEREMAFTSLMKLIGFKGKIQAPYNHSWSEYIVSMSTNNKETINLLVRVDNTFDNIDWSLADRIIIQEIENQKYSCKLERFYNGKANSSVEQSKLKGLIVSKQVSKRIESKLVSYLREELD